MSTLAQSVSSYWCKPVSQRLGQSIPYYPVHTSCKPPIRRRPYQARATMSQSKTVLVPIANGSEEMEAVITIDVLRRAGADVTVASVEDTLEVVCSRMVKLVADALITDCATKPYDLIALPGGMPGAERLRDSATLQTMLKQQQAQGLLDGKKGTCHPAFVDKLADSSNVEQRVVVDGTLTTSRGPGTTFEFALSLVEQLYGEEAAASVAAPMVMYKH